VCTCGCDAPGTLESAASLANSKTSPNFERPRSFGDQSPLVHDQPSQSATRAGRPVDQAKRSAILDAASAQFFEVGFAATSIEQVAADAGVSKVTIYNQFGDKQALFAAAVTRECEAMREHLSIEVQAGDSLRARLTAIGEGITAFLSRSRMIQFERRIAAETQHNPSLRDAFMDNGPRAMLQTFTALLDQMAERGEVEIADRELAAEQFVAMCKGLGDLERRFGAAPDPARDRERIAGAVEVFCRAYGR